MENLPADVLRKTALELAPRDVLSLCLTNKKFKEAVCNSAAFWRNKIQIDYPNQPHFRNLFQNNPKDLYMVLTMNSKIVEITKEEFPDLYQEFGQEYFEDVSEDLTIWLSKDLNSEKGKLFIDEKMIKRGDVLHIGWVSDYRNEGKLIWDGEKAVNLDIEDDDYGSVPSSFSFPEFRPDYFNQSIDHNNIVRLNDEKAQELISNFDEETQTSYITDRNGKYSVKLDHDIENLKIYFGKIFFNINRDYLEYDSDENVLILKVPYGTYSGGSKSTYFYYNIEFAYPEWKNAIVSIVPDARTTYYWDENTLKVEFRPGIWN